MTEVVTVTHATDGIRLAFPNGTSRVYSNSFYLAESHARLAQTAENVRKTLVEGIAASLNELEESVKADRPTENLLMELRDIRDGLCEVAKQLA